MPATPLTDLSRLAVHTMTTKPWSLRQCIEGYAKAGIKGISVWRNMFAPGNSASGTATASRAVPGPGSAAPTPREAGKMLRDAGMSVPALVRGGFFPAHDMETRQESLDDNRRCLDEAAAIDAEMVVLVVGAVPGMALEEARKQVTEGIAALLPDAQARGVKLAIEPLHPMYAGDRSCINRMAEARAVCEQLQHPLVGIAVDVYHVWWDPDLQSEIAKAGEQNTLFAFHICDWRLPTRDLLNDRALMGEGCIDIPALRGWVEDAGFRGFNEVEIFSSDYWAMDQHEYLNKIVEAYREHS